MYIEYYWCCECSLRVVYLAGTIARNADRKQTPAIHALVRPGSLQAWRLFTLRRMALYLCSFSCRQNRVKRATKQQGFAPSNNCHKRALSECQDPSTIEQSKTPHPRAVLYSSLNRFEPAKGEGFSSTGSPCLKTKLIINEWPFFNKNIENWTPFVFIARQPLPPPPSSHP